MNSNEVPSHCLQAHAISLHSVSTPSQAHFDAEPLDSLSLLSGTSPLGLLITSNATQSRMLFPLFNTHFHAKLKEVPL